MRRQTAIYRTQMTSVSRHDAVYDVGPVMVPL